MAVRREVLGDEHVDRAAAQATAFTAAVPGLHHPRTPGATCGRATGLDRRTRSCITLAVLTALRARR